MVVQVIAWIERCEQIMDNSMSFESDIKKKILGRWAKPFTSFPFEGSKKTDRKFPKMSLYRKQILTFIVWMPLNDMLKDVVTID